MPFHPISTYFYWVVHNKLIVVDGTISIGICLLEFLRKKLDGCVNICQSIRASRIIASISVFVAVAT